jgi:hypothetical protein
MFKQVYRRPLENCGMPRARLSIAQPDEQIQSRQPRSGGAAHKNSTGWRFFNTSSGADTAAGALVLGGIGAAMGALKPTRSWLEVYRR